ncbi:hypothetical protein KC354_g2062 [Hortaea werneckii]|nr:hypothetical protein KC354_g2062 [Hortaea werneckii]
MTMTSIRTAFRSLTKPTKWQPDNGPEEHTHILGLRGILSILSVLWIFLHTFVPSVVSQGTEGPTYQKVIRYVFSPVFFNLSLIRTFFFVLSARSICVRFLKRPQSSTYAGSIIRRLIRLPLVLTIACAIVFGVFGGIGVSYIRQFEKVLPNASITAPESPNNALTGLNAIFDQFWIVRSYYYQAANDFWPSGTVWMISLIFQQSWTIYFLMVILPFTRATWHWQFLTLFALGSFWMNTWGWYDASALLLADYLINPVLRARLDSGLEINEDWRIPYAAPGAAMMVAGFAMKYTWTVLPQYIDKELALHPFLDLAENTSRAQFAAADPYPRLDNFLVIFGVLLIVETTPKACTCLSARWLVQLGRRSLSIFVAQSAVFWTIGIKLFLNLYLDQRTSKATANFAVFVVATLSTILFAELFYRLVDLPTQMIASKRYLWLLR